MNSNVFIGFFVFNLKICELILIGTNVFLVTYSVDNPIFITPYPNVFTLNNKYLAKFIYLSIQFNFSYCLNNNYE